MILQLRRWLPHRPLVLVGDRATPSWTCSTAANRWLNPLPSSPACAWTALYEPAPPRQPGQNGRPPLKGRRLPALKTLLGCHPGGTTACPHVADSPRKRPDRSGKPPVPLRWVLVRDPQGNSLPRPCSAPVGGDPGRTGGHLSGGAGSPGRGDPTPVVGPGHCPYYANPDGTLDHPGSPSAAATTTLGPSHSGLVRQAVADLRGCHRSGAPDLWLASEGFSLSAADPDIRKVPAALYHRLVDSLAYAA